MTDKKKKKPQKKSKPVPKAKTPKPAPIWLRLVRVFFVGLGLAAISCVAVTLLYSAVNPLTNYYMLSERYRLGTLKKQWVTIEDVAPWVPRAIVAAEDANFCDHFGFDVAAIRLALSDDGVKGRGASTLSQQVAKNVFLWPGRSWTRKGLEAGFTVLVEIFWSKQRIVEVYMNIAEFDEGVFGVGAAGPHYFGVSAVDLSAKQAARLASVLPNPKGRSASNPTSAGRKRTRSVMSGAETILADGRSDCFEVLNISTSEVK